MGGRDRKGRRGSSSRSRSPSSSSEDSRSRRRGHRRDKEDRSRDKDRDRDRDRDRDHPSKREYDRRDERDRYRDDRERERRHRDKSRRSRSRSRSVERRARSPGDRKRPREPETRDAYSHRGDLPVSAAGQAQLGQTTFPLQYSGAQMQPPPRPTPPIPVDLLEPPQVSGSARVRSPSMPPSPTWEEDDEPQSLQNDHPHHRSPSPPRRENEDDWRLNRAKQNTITCSRCGYLGPATIICFRCKRERWIGPAVCLKTHCQLKEADVRAALRAEGFDESCLASPPEPNFFYVDAGTTLIVRFANSALSNLVLRKCRGFLTVNGREYPMQQDRISGARQLREEEEMSRPVLKWSTAAELQTLLDRIYAGWSSAEDREREYYHKHLPILTELKYKEEVEKAKLSVAAGSSASTATPTPETGVACGGESERVGGTTNVPVEPNSAGTNPTSPTNATSAAAAPSAAASESLQERLARLKAKKLASAPTSSPAAPPTAAASSATTPSQEVQGTGIGSGSAAKPLPAPPAPVERSSVTAQQPIPPPPSSSQRDFTTGELLVRQYGTRGWSTGDVGSQGLSGPHSSDSDETIVIQLRQPDFQYLNAFVTSIAWRGDWEATPLTLPPSTWNVGAGSSRTILHHTHA